MRAHSAALSVFATAIAAPNNRWTPPKPLLLCRDSHVLFLCFCNISIYYSVLERSKSRPARHNRSFLGISIC
jgi:hypothetical protein